MLKLLGAAVTVVGLLALGLLTGTCRKSSPVALPVADNGQSSQGVDSAGLARPALTELPKASRTLIDDGEIESEFTDWVGRVELSGDPDAGSSPGRYGLLNTSIADLGPVPVSNGKFELRLPGGIPPKHFGSLTVCGAAMKVIETRIDLARHTVVLKVEFVAGPRIRPLDALTGVELRSFTLLKPLEHKSLLAQPKFPLGPDIFDFHALGAKPLHALRYASGAAYWVGSEGYQWRRIDVPNGLSIFEPRLQRSGGLRLSIRGDLDDHSTKALRVVDSAGAVHAMVPSSPCREVVITGLAPGTALVAYGRLSDYVRDGLGATRVWRNLAEMKNIEVEVLAGTVSQATIDCPPGSQNYGIVDGSFLLPAEHSSLLNHELSVEFEYLGQERGAHSRSVFEGPFVERTDQGCHFRVPGLLEGSYRATLWPYGFQGEIEVTGQDQTVPAINCTDPTLTVVYLEDANGRRAGGTVWWRKLLPEPRSARRWLSSAVDGSFHILTAPGSLELYGDFLSDGDQMESGQAGDVLVLASSPGGHHELTVEFRLAGVPVGVPLASVVAIQAIVQEKVLLKEVIPQPATDGMGISDPLASPHRYLLTFQGGFPDKLLIHPMLDFEVPNPLIVTDAARESGMMVIALTSH